MLWLRIFVIPFLFIFYLFIFEPSSLLPLTHGMHVSLHLWSEIVPSLSPFLSDEASICQRDRLQSGLSLSLIYYGPRPYNCDLRRGWGLLFDRLPPECARLADRSRSVRRCVLTLRTRRICTNLPHKALIYLGYGFSSGSPVLLFIST